jgi:C-terminal processing protease CtpA/Prc
MANIIKSGAHPFNEALAAAKEKSCENFVIDLSANIGGSDDVMGFILSSMILSRVPRP